MSADYRTRSAVLLAWVGGIFSTGTWWLQVTAVGLLLIALYMLHSRRGVND